MAIRSAKSEWLSGEMFERRIRFSDAIYTAGRSEFQVSARDYGSESVLMNSTREAR